VVYVRANRPVIVERQLGRGTIVLSGDSYFFSNQALRNERRPRLLAWIIDPNREVVFDEWHHGIKKSPGIASLARKYGLYWLFPAILLVAGLFVWKNASYFMPPRDDKFSTEDHDITSGRDYTDGLVSMLRRNVSTRDILNVCFKEWKASLSAHEMVSADTLNRVRDLIIQEQSRSPRKRDPVTAYRKIQKILTERDR
jgi:hypothetical protein